MAPVPLAEAEKTGLEFAKKAGYPSLSALRKLSTKEIYELYVASKRFGFPVTIDGYFLTATLPEIFEAKKQAMVPLLVGWNSAEIPGFGFMQGSKSKEENFILHVKQNYPNDYEEVLKLYPHGNDKEIEWSATALSSDRFIAYSTWKWFDLHRKNSTQPVYRYLYSKLLPPLTDQNLSAGLAGGTSKKDPNAFKMPEPIGAPHACEIEYCMGNLHLVTDHAWTGDDYAVSETMQNFFANFIMTGNPNSSKVPEWPAAKANDNNPDIMVIDVQSKSIKAADDARYIFLDRAYKNTK